MIILCGGIQEMIVEFLIQVEIGTLCSVVKASLGQNSRLNLCPNQKREHEVEFPCCHCSIDVIDAKVLNPRGVSFVAET